MGPLPGQPPKPRVVKLGDTWVLDTGHADVLHDSWTDAIQHAERICGDYVRRLLLWVAMNRSTVQEPETFAERLSRQSVEAMEAQVAVDWDARNAREHAAGEHPAGCTCQDAGSSERQE